MHPLRSQLVQPVCVACGLNLIHAAEQHLGVQYSARMRGHKTYVPLQGDAAHQHHPVAMPSTDAPASSLGRHTMDELTPFTVLVKLSVKARDQW